MVSKLQIAIFQEGISTTPGIVTIDRDELEDSYNVLFNLDDPKLEEIICDSLRYNGVNTLLVHASQVAWL